MSIDELFGRCVELATGTPSVAANRFMHETLVLCCAEVLKTSEMAFGNLFSQVDYLAKRCAMRTSDRMISHHSSPFTLHPSPFTNARYIRCIISRFDEQTLWGDTSDGQTIVADYAGHE